MPDEGDRMKRISLVLAIMFCLTLMTVARAEPKFYHGTLNLILGNKQGLVVATDSCATETDRQGAVIGRTYNHQKLFKITKDVVITIAGYNSADVPAATAFTSPAASLILQYVEELKSKNYVPAYREIIDSLSYIITFHLDAVANVNYITDFQPDVKGYEFHMVIAGKYHDNLLITKIIVKPEIASDGKHVEFKTFIQGPIEAKDKFIFVTAGWTKKADDILKNPSRYTSFPAIANYANQLGKDAGEHLTTADMKDIAKTIMDIASNDYEGIGGPTQIAIFDSKEFITSIPYFPPPKASPIRFNYLVRNSFIGGKYAIKSSSAGLVIANNFEDTGIILDNLYYFGNTLRNCTVYLSNNKFSFHILNTVENCRLIIGRDVDINSSAVKFLISNFHWKTVEKGVDLKF